MENIRSSGCLFYTGTGSTAWAKTMNLVSDQNIEVILKLHDSDINEFKINEIQRKFHKRRFFTPDSLLIGFLHREILSRYLSCSNEGTGQKFELKNKTLRAFIAIDGYKEDLDFEDTLKIEKADNKFSLACWKLDN